MHPFTYQQSLLLETLQRLITVIVINVLNNNSSTKKICIDAIILLRNFELDGSENKSITNNLDDFAAHCKIDPGPMNGVTSNVIIYCTHTHFLADPNGLHTCTSLSSFSLTISENVGSKLEWSNAVFSDAIGKLSFGAPTFFPSSLLPSFFESITMFTTSWEFSMLLLFVLNYLLLWRYFFRFD